jgi:CMP-N,N'-diacetyllegionaminic acid synthase
MFNNIIALIPAKYNSKSIKNKNLKKIGDKSLIEIAIDETKKSKQISKIYLNSESNIIAKIARKKKINFFQRDKKLSKKDTGSNLVIKDFIKKLKLKDNDILIYLQPTSPFRKIKHIDESIKKFLQKPELSLVSVKKNDQTIFKSVKKIKNNVMIPIFNSKFLTMNRQDFQDTYISNGSIYIFKIKNFKINNSIPVKKFQPYLMNKQESLDIDNINDLMEARRAVLR